MKHFVKLIKVFFSKRSILNIWQGSEYTSAL